MTDEEKLEDFKNMVRYFWLEKGDPERFTGWDEAYCEKVWPGFLYAWRQHKATEQILDALCGR